MRYIPNAEQMKSADQYTIHTLSVPSLQLMEQAAGACVEVMKEKSLDLSNVCIVCGSGNNGGDGFAIARILASEGMKVSVYMAGNISRCTVETNYQIEKLKEYTVTYVNDLSDNEYSIIVDAVFGVGLSRKIEGNYKEIIDKLNRMSGVKFAVDIPSGISADNGGLLGVAFQADYTVTFQAEKMGLMLYPGKEYAGEVIVKDIGISDKYFDSDQDVAVALEVSDYKKMLPVRREDSHKGTYGNLLIIAGSKGMSGAAFLNAMAAYLVGAGLVQIYTSEDNRIILQQLIPEAIITTYKEYDEKQLLQLIDWADVICMGSGMSISDVSKKIVKTVLLKSEIPCVIDADGLNILSQHLWYLEKRKHNNYIFTPHMKEMYRLTGVDIGTIKESRKQTLEAFAAKYGITCILKDSKTLIKSMDERLVVNISGNSAMAKAGSGDVLAGIVAGLLAQTKCCHNAAVLGTYLHGLCGDEARQKKGSYSVMARDLLDNISIVLKREEG